MSDPRQGSDFECMDCGKTLVRAITLSWWPAHDGTNRVRCTDCRAKLGFRERAI